MIGTTINGIKEVHIEKLSEKALKMCETSQK